MPFSLSPDYLRVIKAVSKAVNLDWINNQACSLSQNIYVITHLFYNEQLSFWNDEENHFTDYFSEFIHQVAIKFRFRKAREKKGFKFNFIFEH